MCCNFVASNWVCWCVWLACALRSISNDEEVDDPGSKVQGHVCFTMDHCNTVSVPITSPGHTTTEQQEWRPTETRKHMYTQGSSSVPFVQWLMCNNGSHNISEKLNIRKVTTPLSLKESDKKNLFHRWMTSSYPSSVGSWTILEMALQGKCPAIIKHK